MTELKWTAGRVVLYVMALDWARMEFGFDTVFTPALWAWSLWLVADTAVTVRELMRVTGKRK